MDFLKKVANQQDNAASLQGDAAAQQTNPATGDKEDYIDKGDVQMPSAVNG